MLLSLMLAWLVVDERPSSPQLDGSPVELRITPTSRLDWRLRPFEVSSGRHLLMLDAEQGSFFLVEPTELGPVSSREQDRHRALRELSGVEDRAAALRALLEEDPQTLPAETLLELHWALLEGERPDRAVVEELASGLDFRAPEEAQAYGSGEAFVGLAVLLALYDGEEDLARLQPLPPMDPEVRAALALQVHRLAQGQRTEEVYALAAELYQPADQAILWLQADCLLHGGQPRRAAEAYEALLDSPWREDALLGRAQARRSLVPSLQPSEPAAEGPTPLSEDHQALVLAYQDLAAEDSLQVHRVAALYVVGEVYFEHGHYEQARLHLLPVVHSFPESDEALWASRLIVNSYHQQGRLEEMLAFIRSLDLPPSEDPFIICELGEGHAFKMASVLSEEGDHLGAARAYEQLFEEFPDSENARIALYNAGNNFEKAGDAEKASELFTRFVNEYPSDELTPPLLFRLASLCYSRLQLDDAIAYYDRLAQDFPDTVDAGAALFNASYLRAAQGDHLGAARGYERYAALYPDAADAEAVMWLAGEQWKRVGDRQTVAFYRQRFLVRYGASSPEHNAEHVIAARAWLAEGDPAQWAALRSDYALLEAEGPMGPVARHHRGRLALRDGDLEAVLTYQDHESTTEALFLLGRHDANLALAAERGLETPWVQRSREALDAEQGRRTPSTEARVDETRGLPPPRSGPVIPSSGADPGV